VRIDSFIGPAHVSTVIGADPYAFFAEEFAKAVAVAGFEPLDVLLGVLMLLRQVNNGRHEVENEYGRAVRPGGNERAKAEVAEFFELRKSFEWRGLGFVAYSGLRLKEKNTPPPRTRRGRQATRCLPAEGACPHAAEFLWLRSELSRGALQFYSQGAEVAHALDLGPPPAAAPAGAAARHEPAVMGLSFVGKFSDKCLPASRTRSHNCCNAVRMGENLEAVAAGYGDKRHADVFSRADSQRRRRGNGDKDRHAEHGSLLHHLDRHAARKQQHAVLAGNALSRQRAEKLVKRIMPADIFTHREEGAGLPEGRGVHGMGLPVQFLASRQGFECLHDIERLESLGVAYLRQRPHRLGKTFDAA
jgi:hypothetical protein